MDIYTTREVLKNNLTSIFDLNLRVAYYARVSTEKEEQKVSLEHQQDYYREYIQSKNNWIFVDGYIDDGVSAISTTKREEFQRMVLDAKAGKIDLIITKEITRFARNVLDSIKYTRELLSNGTAVWFQNDAINTLDEDSEFRLTVMSGIAQEDSRKMSSRIRFGQARSIEKGVVLGNSHIYGWDKHNGRLFINEEEAKMIRLIFEKYASGEWSTNALEKWLWELGYRNYKGGKISSRVIGNIIRNPKYKGYYVGGKVKIVDLFTKKQKFLPEDQWVMYKDDGSRVPAIVDEKLWNSANKILEERGATIKNRHTSFKHDNIFTGIIRCANDGATFWLKVRTIHGKECHTWICSHKIKNGAASCKSIAIKEEDLLNILSNSFNMIAYNTNDYAVRYAEFYKKESYRLTNDAQNIEEIEQDIIKLEKKREKLLDFSMAGYITNAEFVSRNEGFTKAITNKKLEIERIKETHPIPQEEILALLDKTSKLAQEYTSSNPKDITRAKVENLIDTIIIKSLGEKKAEVSILYKNGLPRKKMTPAGSLETISANMVQEKPYISENGTEYLVFSAIKENK